MSGHVHQWGVSAAADRVWTHVNGLAPSRRAGRLLMVWQAYFDESADDGLFVIAGYLAPAEAWANFAAEWEAMLPMGVLGPDGRHRFKMAEMAALPERMARVSAFYRIIEKHASVAVSFTLDLAAFEAAKARILLLDPITRTIKKAGGKLFDNPYVYANGGMMRTFHNNRANPELQELIPLDQRVDFIFDDRLEKKHILSEWDLFISHGERRDLYGAAPRFENDDDFLPLQAADLWAWWVRQGDQTGEPPRPPWKTTRAMPWCGFVWTKTTCLRA